MAGKVCQYQTKKCFIQIDEGKCISCGTCAALAPQTFQLGDNFKSTVKEDSEDDLQTILKAAQSCPVGAIAVKDKETGKNLYPK